MPEISQQVKAVTYGFYADAMNGDHRISIPGCKNLVATLISSAMILNATEYESTLEKCYVWANRANYLYFAEHDEFGAIEFCNNIILNVTPIINEPAGRFASVKLSDFKYSKPVNDNV